MSKTLKYEVDKGKFMIKQVTYSKPASPEGSKGGASSIVSFNKKQSPNVAGANSDTENIVNDDRFQLETNKMQLQTA